MDWQKCMNQAVDYIENNLSDEIDYTVAAQFMNCSVWEFQRLFSFMAKVPLSEYIRRRRLTLAAHDIQISKDKIIDIALRYGYDSHASFSRAFNQLHGTTPKAAHYNGIGSFWSEWNNSDICQKMGEKYSIDKSHIMDISTPTTKTEEFDYTIGFMYNGAENEDGLDIITVPSGTYIVFDIPPEYRNNIGSFMGRAITEYLPSLGYALDGVDAEYFSDNKMEAWFLVK